MFYQSLKNYGDVMKPLVLTDLHPTLQAQLAASPKLLEFVKLADQVHRAEKITSFNDWTPEERHAYDSGDSVSFSRLRGYTEDEIQTFLHYLAVSQVLIDEMGEDEVASIEFEMQQATSTPEFEQVEDELRRMSRGAARRLSL